LREGVHARVVDQYIDPRVVGVDLLSYALDVRDQ
jgi:hypothetical protein